MGESVSVFVSGSLCGFECEHWDVSLSVRV